MKIQVAIFFGGESVEHEISIISAVQAMQAFDVTKYQTVPFYIAKDRKIYSSNNLLELETYRDLNQITQPQQQVIFFKSNGQVYYRFLKEHLWGKNPAYPLDVALPIIHGTNGEDGTVQGFLEMLDLPYSGCDVIAAGVGQDKVFMKQILAANDLPIVPWTWFLTHEYQLDPTNFLAKIEALGYPVVVKPARLGSSVGISVAKDEAEVKEAIKLASEFDWKIVIEKAVENLIEINCSVLGDLWSQTASVLEQVGGTSTLLTYFDKYQSNDKSKGMASATRIIPAPLSATMTSQIQALAKATFLALGASGVSRIDFLVDSATQAVYVNEINTIPGSLAFYLWQASGVDYPALLEQLIEQAIDRKRQKAQLTFSYDTNILANYAGNGSKGVKK